MICTCAACMHALYAANGMMYPCLPSHRIFEIAPEAIKLFPKFADVPPKELEKNEHFRHHALQVVEAVELAISMLQDVDDLRDVLISLGSIHVSMGLQDVHFDVRMDAHETSLLHHNIYCFFFVLCRW